MRVFGNDYPKLHVNKKYAADIASFCVFFGGYFLLFTFFLLPFPLSNAQLQLIFKNINNLITLFNVFFRSHIFE